MTFTIDPTSLFIWSAFMVGGVVAWAAIHVCAIYVCANMYPWLFTSISLVLIEVLIIFCRHFGV